MQAVGMRDPMYSCVSASLSNPVMDPLHRLLPPSPAVMTHAHGHVERRGREIMTEWQYK